MIIELSISLILYYYWGRTLLVWILSSGMVEEVFFEVFECFYHINKRCTVIIENIYLVQMVLNTITE